MEQNKKREPDNTAVRVALWRALHAQVDAPPHIIEDKIGIELVAPPDGWKDRPDMDTEFTKRLRASIVARARFVDDLVEEQVAHGISQYVILGAGLDTFAQRKSKIASKLQVYEIDQPDTQAWKQQRLVELGYGIPERLHFVSVDFEAGASWWEQLTNAGFDVNQPAIVACTGVSLYLTKDAILTTLLQIATLAPGSILAMTFYLPINLMDAQDRPLQEIAEKGARAAGTPFVSFFSPEEILALGCEAGFKEATTVSTDNLTERYFAGRTDGFSPASGEVFLVANVS